MELSASNDRRRAEPDLNRGDFGFDQNRGPIMGEREKSLRLPPRLFLKVVFKPSSFARGLRCDPLQNAHVPQTKSKGLQTTFAFLN
jgi:hypothetical protein